MKKLIIIFIIAFCLLSFMKISCLANESSSSGEFWNSMDDNNKEVYIWGIREGIVMCMEQITERFLVPASKNKENTAIIEAILEDYYQFVMLFRADDYETTLNLLKTVVNIVSDLYKDPANTYVNISDMCFLASRKLRGEPIDSLLGELRKKALP
mgnify:CR=1 FL=1